MKDSQLEKYRGSDLTKYIKANNERFSTATYAQQPAR